MSKGKLRKVFDKRVKYLNLGDQAKEELFLKFLKSWDAGFRCLYCKKEMDLPFEHEYSFSIDHTIPRAKGGKDEVSNLEIVCRNCNYLKGTMSAKKYINRMRYLNARKLKREAWKAKRAAKKDEQTREAYKGIFEMLNAKGETK